MDGLSPYVRVFNTTNALIILAPYHGDRRAQPINCQHHQVMEASLEKYADEGIVPIEDVSVLRVHPFSHMERPIELIR